MRYVLFKTNPNTRQEEYLLRLLTGPAGPGFCVSENASEAMAFETAAEAYRFGGACAPLFAWWRVGLR